MLRQHNFFSQIFRRLFLVVVAFALVLTNVTSSAFAVAPQDTYGWIKNIGTSGCPPDGPTSIATMNGKIYTINKTGTISVMDAGGATVLQFAITPSVTQALLTYVSAIAVDSSGNIYMSLISVSPTYTYTPAIQKYSPSGTLLLQFGLAGSGNGQLYPYSGGSIALDSAGNIYVGDAGNYRVQKFDPNGNYLSQFGSLGTGNGQFGLIYDMTINGSGTIDVVDSYGRVQTFNSAGIYQSSFLLAPTTGSNTAGQWIARDATNNIYVATSKRTYDSSLSTYTYYPTMQKYSSTGTLLSQFGSYGIGNGQFGGDPQMGTVEAMDIALDSTGGIFVTDSANKRIEKFDTNGAYQAQFTLSGDSTRLCMPYGVARSATGDLYVADYAWNNIKVYAADGSLKKVFGSVGTGNGEFQGPAGVALDSAGNIYVSDVGSARIQKFDSNGSYLSQFGSYGNGNGQFSSPIGIVIDQSGTIYVADSTSNRIQKFDPNGQYVSQFAMTSSGGASGTSPGMIALDASGDLYATVVSNTGGTYFPAVQKYSSDGSFISQFGSSGTGDGQFSSAIAGIAVDHTGDIYVTDLGNSRIQKFDPNGNYLSQFGAAGTAQDQFTYPVGIVFDPNGNVYVTNADVGYVNGVAQNVGRISVWNAPIIPSAPQGLVQSTTGSTVHLIWMPPQVVGSLTYTYTIQYRIKGTTTWTTAVQNLPSSTTTYDLASLTVGTAYDVQITAVNSLGSSPVASLSFVMGEGNGLADTGSDVWMYGGVAAVGIVAAGSLLWVVRRRTILRV